MSNEYTVFAASREIQAGDTAPEWVMYMPAGKNEITASQGGKAAKLTVHVEEKDAVLLQNALDGLFQAGGPEPYVGFDHVAGPAGFWPKAFKWEDGDKPGIYVKAEWTKKGSESVMAKEYRYFSPTFLFDGKAIKGLPDKGEIGSLVNNPAFRSIKAVAAQQTNTETNMDESEKKALEASLAERDKTIAALQAEVEAMKKDKAKCAVQAAVAEGKIAPQDTATQEKWEKLVHASADAVALLNALPVTNKPSGKALTSDTKVDASNKEVEPDYDAIRVRAADIAKSGSIPYHAAYLQACNEKGAQL